MLGHTAVALPKYKCIKEVWAAKITRIEWVAESNGNRLFFREIGGYMDVSFEWSMKHTPEVGGYWVRYADGYESYSPAAAFENGYIKI